MGAPREMSADSDIIVFAEDSPAFTGRCKGATSIHRRI